MKLLIVGIATAIATVIISGGITLYLVKPPEQIAPEEQLPGEPDETEQNETKQTTKNTTEPQDYELSMAVGEGQGELVDYQNQIATAKTELAAIKAEIEAETKTRNSEQESEARTKQLAKLYSSMKPNSVVAILSELDDALSAKILSEMNDKTASKLLDTIATSDPTYAVKISKLIVAARTAKNAEKPIIQ